VTISPEELIRQADAMNVRLEIVRGLPIWEASPVLGHQIEIDRIRASITAQANSGCACFHTADVIFKFPDGSFKRPDIAILCETPDRSEFFSALERIPEAVVEVISEGYERKDEAAPEFYLSSGVKDVMILNPRSLEVFHYTAHSLAKFVSPASIQLECGCLIEV
jgi:Uma2 family endonuclease